MGFPAFSCERCLKVAMFCNGGDSLKIKRPVTVKTVLTDKLRSNLESEYNQTIHQLQLELEQLRFQSKKLLQNASKKGPDALQAAQERLQKEETRRQDQIDKIHELKNQLQILPNGSEIVQAQAETEVEVKIGDAWDKMMNEAEIIVKDGIVVEIRS